MRRSWREVKEKYFIFLQGFSKRDSFQAFWGVVEVPYTSVLPMREKNAKNVLAHRALHMLIPTIYHSKQINVCGVNNSGWMIQHWNLPGYQSWKLVCAFLSSSVVRVSLQEKTIALVISETGPNQHLFTLKQQSLLVVVVITARASGTKDEVRWRGSNGSSKILGLDQGVSCSVSIDLR